ncbi:MAG: CRISPR-associated protein Cas4 [Verrucomicrobiales bacterium]|nr:CRISPR-associated protein Cas4 [Verrucomicrobiales bacterium]
MELLPLSGLQHYLYCPRQFALIHVEQQWAENQFTAEGNVMHEKAHSGADEHRVGEGVKITRSIPVKSEEMGLSGQCDIVEFHKSGDVIPVEYKRGKPKDHSADEVQLCAQAMCLEEMLGCTIPLGYLFYGKRKRRTPIELNEQLRQLTRRTAEAFHHLFASGETPEAVYESRKCGACSLVEICQPKLSKQSNRSAAAWFDKAAYD